MDVTISVLGLLFSSPVVGLAMLLIWLEDRHSPLFRQQRVGKNEEPFEILKLRSMSPDTPDLASAEAGAVAVTRVGRIIRRLNIDELPQLWCIARGDMSLVGPRPALPSQTNLLNLRRANGAASIKPGLTGLAQLRAYDDMPESEKAAHDGEYAENVGALFDMRLILRTAAYLLKPPPQY